MSKLKLRQFNTYHVDWLTYAHDRESGVMGLGEFISKQLGRPGKDEIELLECGNDTHHLVHAELSKFDLGEIWVKEHAELVDRMQRLGHVEVWRMRPILLACVERGWIPPGYYVVKMSW